MLPVHFRSRLSRYALSNPPTAARSPYEKRPTTTTGHGIRGVHGVHRRHRPHPTAIQVERPHTTANTSVLLSLEERLRIQRMMPHLSVATEAMPSTLSSASSTRIHEALQTIREVTKEQLEDANDPLRLVEVREKQEEVRQEGRRSHRKTATSSSRDDRGVLRMLAERNKELEAQILDLEKEMLDVEKKMSFRGGVHMDLQSRHDGRLGEVSRKEEWLSSRVEFLEKKVAYYRNRCAMIEQKHSSLFDSVVSHVLDSSVSKEDRLESLVAKLREKLIDECAIRALEWDLHNQEMMELERKYMDLLSEFVQDDTEDEDEDEDEEDSSVDEHG